MLSLSLIAVPVFLDTTTQGAQLLQQWERMYHYGHQALPTMAVGTFVLYAYVAFKRRRRIFALAGSITVIMVPYTWFIMMPTNNELFRLEELARTEPAATGIAEARKLVVSWSWMHLTRALAPLAGAVVGALAIFGS